MAASTSVTKSKSAKHITSSKSPTGTTSSKSQTGTTSEESTGATSSNSETSSTSKPVDHKAERLEDKSESKKIINDDPIRFTKGIPASLLEKIKNVEMKRQESEIKNDVEYVTYTSPKGYQVFYRNYYWSIKCVVRGYDDYFLLNTVTMGEGLKDCSSCWEFKIPFGAVSLVPIKEIKEAEDCLKEVKRIEDMMHTAQARAAMIVTALKDMKELNDHEVKDTEKEGYSPVEFLRAYCSRIETEKKLEETRRELDENKRLIDELTSKQNELTSKQANLDKQMKSIKSKLIPQLHSTASLDTERNKISSAHCS